ncbi:MAG TPA: glycoside hydrolase family 9 protein [Chitinophagaceae bacterium]
MKLIKEMLALAATGITLVAVAQPAGSIRINQAGYYTNGPKVVVVTGTGNSDRFFVLTAEGRDTVFKGVLSAEKTSLFSSTKTRVGDFSKVQKSGRYVIAVPGAGPSFPFRVADDVHHEVAVASLKGFYYQRSNEPLEEKHAGKWHRPAGHPDTEVLVHPSAASKERPAGTVISSPGGWYDAGDYNKYIVNSGITMGTLFSAYEDLPKYWTSLKVNIPESGDALPDLLNEALYNLRWMLTMQDPHDGGVYHKLTNALFDGMVMPGVTKAPRYVVQKGTGAALDFAAVMAQAARVFRPFEKQVPGLADSCLKAAERAWQWAEQHPDVRYSQREINPVHKPDVLTGEYGDRNFRDEVLWAAAELFVTTGQKKYFDAVSERRKDPAGLPGWSNVGMLGYYTLLRHQKALPSYAVPVTKAMRDTVLRIADLYLANTPRNAFATVMGQSARDFIWGSSSVAANQGILLVNAYLLTGHKRYLDYALTNMDYLLGRNGTGYSFVTGIGTKSTLHPHHRPSVADGVAEPVPGLLAGGPNPAMQDKCVYEFTEPETAYSDTDCSYASNEIAINWNAPLVYLAGALEALQKKAGYVKK